MDDSNYEREKTTICTCGRSVYSQSSIAVGRGSGTIVTLEGAYILKCLYCGQEGFVEVTRDGMYRYQLRGQSCWDRINELVFEQWDSRLETPLKFPPVQDIQRKTGGVR